MSARGLRSSVLGLLPTCRVIRNAFLPFLQFTHRKEIKKYTRTRLQIISRRPQLSDQISAHTVSRVEYHKLLKFPALTHKTNILIRVQIQPTLSWYIWGEIIG